MAANIPIETVRTDGLAMDYFRFGHGAKPLVILPGLSVQSVMGSADAVAEAYRLWTDDYTVFVLDRRRALPAAYPVRTMARDTAAAIDALGLGRVALFGVSQGGMIAMAAAIDRPDAVEALALGSTAARMTETAARTAETWIRLAKAGDAAGLYLAFGEAVYPRSVFDAARPQLLAAAETVTRGDLARFAILAEGMRGFDATADLRSVACPVFVLGDDDDRVLGADASRELAALLAGRADCAFYEYHGCGHAAYDVAPDYKARVLRFLREAGMSS